MNPAQGKDDELNAVLNQLGEQARREENRREADRPVPFDPREDISADARYLWKNIFIWFWVVPAAAGVIYLLMSLSSTPHLK